MPTLRDFVPPIFTNGFTRAGRASGRKSVAFEGDAAAWLNMPLGEASYTVGRSFANTVMYGYGQNPYLFRAVRIIAQGVSGIPWLLYQDRMSRDKGDTLDTHPSLLLLNVRANPLQSAQTFWQYLVTDLLLAGDAYVLVLQGRLTTELHTLRPDWVKPIFDQRSGELLTYEYGYANHKRQYDPADILHLQEVNPLRGGSGIGPAKIAGRSVDQMTAANDWNTALQQNMARPSGLLSPDVVLTEEQKDSLKRELQEKYGGPKNAGRPLVPRGPMKWQQMGMTPTDMDWLQGKEAALREVATAFGVAPELLGDAAGKTFANMAEARASLYTETIFPLMDMLAGSFSAWLLPMYTLDPMRYDYDYDRDAVEAIQEDRGQVWDRAESASFLTINEKREMLGLEDIGADGDVILVPNTMVPLEQSLEPPAPPPVIHMLPPGNGGQDGNGNGSDKPSGQSGDGNDKPNDKPGQQTQQATGTDGGKSVVLPFAPSARSRAYPKSRPGGLRNSSVTRMR